MRTSIFTVTFWPNVTHSKISRWNSNRTPDAIPGSGKAGSILSVPKVIETINLLEYLLTSNDFITMFGTSTH